MSKVIRLSNQTESQLERCKAKMNEFMKKCDIDLISIKEKDDAIIFVALSNYTNYIDKKMSL